MRVRDVVVFVAGVLLGCFALMAMREHGAGPDASRQARPVAMLTDEAPAVRLAVEARDDPPSGAAAPVATDTSAGGRPQPLPPGLSLVHVAGVPMLCDAACRTVRVQPLLDRLIVGAFTAADRVEAEAMTDALATRLAEDPMLRARFIEAAPALLAEPKSRTLTRSLLRLDGEARAAVVSRLSVEADPAARRAAMKLVVVGSTGQDHAASRGTPAGRRIIARTLASEQDESVLLEALSAARFLERPLPDAADRAVTLAIYGSTERVRLNAATRAFALDPELPAVRRLARQQLRDGTSEQQAGMLIAIASRGQADLETDLSFYNAEAQRIARDPNAEPHVINIAEVAVRQTRADRSR